MTMSIGRPTSDGFRAAEFPDPLNPTPIGNEVIMLLTEILSAVKQNQPMAQLPTPGVYELGITDASPNGRQLIGSNKIRLERIVLIYTGAITFTIQKGSAAKLSLPVTVAGFGVIDLPWTDVLERGVALQILASAATWTGYVIGYPE